MNKTFQRIGLIGRQRREDISDTLLSLYQILAKRKLSVVIEEETATCLKKLKLPTFSRDEIGKHCDLIIVVGGDGSLLNAARSAINANIPILGINRGHLGFLTDIHPKELNKKINAVLDGKYQIEERSLLETKITYNNKTKPFSTALNDVVLMPGDVAHMIEFAITINDQFVCTQRADGLIVATPTGSTAYALSGGGPILHPQLDAVVLVPMFPHTLSARPIVIDAKSTIRINIPEVNETSPRLSCDGQSRLVIKPGSDIEIRQHPKMLRLIHPIDYNYFTTLREKLHWSKKL